MNISPHFIVWELLSRKVDAVDRLQTLESQSNPVDEKSHQDKEQLNRSIEKLDNHIENVNNLVKFIGLGNGK